MNYSNINHIENFIKLKKPKIKKIKLKKIGEGAIKTGKGAAKLGGKATQGGTKLLGDSMGNVWGGAFGGITDGLGISSTQIIIGSVVLLVILIVMGIAYKNFTS
jgi:hypothetical protein